ncbi:MAG: hypothetical protein AAFU85_01815 [Planctomycetota bacterium]
MSDSPPNSIRHVGRWRRFAIGSLLFLVFCFAGAFVGFRYGLSEAVEAQVEQRLNDLRNSQILKVYRVADLVTSGPNSQLDAKKSDDLIRALMANANEETTTISPTPTGDLVISGSALDHDSLVAFLNGLRHEFDGEDSNR